MKKGSILTLLIFILLAATAFWIVNKSRRPPTEQTQNIAKLVTKYPNSRSWQVSSATKICFFETKECYPPQEINFSSKDPWSQVYKYYKDTMQKVGWKTNSEIFTSIPTGIVFYTETFKDGTKCESYLTEVVKSDFIGREEQKGDIHVYKFTVTCLKTVN